MPSNDNTLFTIIGYDFIIIVIIIDLSILFHKNVIILGFKRTLT